MSVTFNRKALISTAEQAIREHNKARAEYAQAVEAFKAKHAAKNINSAAIRKFRDFLTAGLKTGKPITRAEARGVAGHSSIEYLFYSSPSDYDVKQQVSRPTGLLSPAQVTETQALIKVLQAATGDTVTANELKLLGLKNLGPVFAAAAAQVGTAVGK